MMSSNLIKKLDRRYLCIILLFLATGVLLSYKLVVSPIVPEMWIWKQNVAANYLQISPFGQTCDSYEDSTNRMSYFPVSYYPIKTLSDILDVTVHSVSRIPMGLIFVFVSFIVIYSLFGIKSALITTPLLAFGPMNLVYIGSAFNNSIIAISFYPLIFLTMYYFLKNNDFKIKYFLFFIIFFLTMFFSYHTSAFIMGTYFLSFAILLLILAIYEKQGNLMVRSICVLGFMTIPLIVISYISGFNLVRVLSVSLESISSLNILNHASPTINPYVLKDTTYSSLLITDFIIYGSIGAFLLFKLFDIYRRNKGIENVIFFSFILSTIPIVFGLFIFGMPERILEHTVFPIVFGFAFLISKNKLGKLNILYPLLITTIFIISAISISTTHIQKMRQYSEKDVQVINWYGNLDTQKNELLLSDLRMGFPIYGFTGKGVFTSAKTTGRLTPLTYYEGGSVELYNTIKDLNGRMNAREIKYILYTDNLFDEGVVDWDLSGIPASYTKISASLNDSNFDKVYSSGEKYFVLKLK